MRDVVTTIGEVAGAFLVAYGAWLVYAPAGFIVAGVLTIFFAYMAAA